MEFKSFGKIPRLSRDCIITEKLDGTNAQIYIGEDDTFLVGSRNRWITPESDNFGFAAWAFTHRDELMELGPGHHYGEWWGQGIQRRYDLEEKRFSLFNVSRWANNPERPSCCHVVPTLYIGEFDTNQVDIVLEHLAGTGSVASPGFANPEGIIVYHTVSRQMFKKTIHGDDIHKSMLA